MRFFQGTQKRVRNSRGKRAISIRAIEVLLYSTTIQQNKMYIDLFIPKNEFKVHVIELRVNGMLKVVYV